MTVTVYVSDEGDFRYERHRGDPERVMVQVCPNVRFWPVDTPVKELKAPIVTEPRIYYRMLLTIEAPRERLESEAYEERAKKLLQRLLENADGLPGQPSSH